MSDQPRATVRMVDGQPVLDDPLAVELIKAVEKHNCRQTPAVNADRVRYFAQRMIDRGDSPADTMIVVLCMDDPHAVPVGDALMPGFDWAAIRARGEIPFARGLAKREFIQAMLDAIDPAAAAKLRAIAGAAVLVMDHGVAEIFTEPLT
jgi:hypothetical protein